MKTSPLVPGTGKLFLSRLSGGKTPGMSASSVTSNISPARQVSTHEPPVTPPGGKSPALTSKEGAPRSLTIRDQHTPHASTGNSMRNLRGFLYDDTKDLLVAVKTLEDFEEEFQDMFEDECGFFDDEPTSPGVGPAPLTVPTPSPPPPIFYKPGPCHFCGRISDHFLDGASGMVPAHKRCIEAHLPEIGT